MVNLENLKFATKEIDTSMAKEYVKKINESTDWPENGWYHIETKPNYIIKSERAEFFLMRYINSTERAVIKNALAKKIIENAEMFVQLEYLARRTDPRDVREGHIQLMSQLAMCKSTHWNQHKILHFTNTTPLYYLATVIFGFVSEESRNPFAPLIMVEDKSMIPLCKYFVELCHDVGLPAAIIYANLDDAKKMHRFSNAFWQEADDSIGCTGVVAERSDLDSAIDVFIDSSVTAPWRLTQVYVQESVFEDFKDALEAKARVDGTNHSHLLVGDKTFLIECLESGQVGIPVHGYRTTKELLTLIKTPYLSVWAAESALSHEIALRTASSTVWVNDYGSFYGPPRASLSVYNVTYKQDLYTPSTIMESLDSWKKLDRNHRFEVISAAYKATNDTKQLNCIKLDLLHHSDDNFLHVTEKTICFGLPKSGILIGLHCGVPLMDALKILMMGNAAALDMGMKLYDEFINQLKIRGAPIDIGSRQASLTSINTTYQVVFENLKVIRTNYGTIFAN